jgi:hypothetical protein
MRRCNRAEQNGDDGILKADSMAKKRSSTRNLFEPFGPSLLTRSVSPARFPLFRKHPQRSTI